MKILIIESVQINLGDDRGGVHHNVGELADVPKDTARQLTELGRALYTRKEDDHTKAAVFTASTEMVKAAEAAAKAAAKAAAAA